MQFNAPKALELQVILVNTINLHRLEVGIGGDHLSLFISRYLMLFLISYLMMFQCRYKNLVENRFSHLSDPQSLGMMVIVYNFHMIL